MRFSVEIKGLYAEPVYPLSLATPLLLATIT